MSLRIRPEAEGDILSAAEWYNERGPGLGAEFIAEIDAGFGRITQGPHRFRGWQGNVRVALCHRFPYAIYSVSEGDDVVVLAVLHQRRDRNAVKERLGE
ncbi:MAG: type II toxin-antitoxin system RelE/ParE family toxin [Alphaproteobacteria bacterium]|nr:type II toxin-antitoxin system RelE/ParE family toxin [Alphaproteobacteria bacterium]